MSVLNECSTRQNDRSTESNKRVAERCMADSSLLAEIATGLSDRDGNLSGDCAEVMTMVAEHQPHKVAPFSEHLLALISHKKTRVRWEAMHALAYIAAYDPELILPHCTAIAECMRSDSSIIVCDYAIDTLAALPSIGHDVAKDVCPLLIESLGIREGRHAGHSVMGLEYVVAHVPECRESVRKELQPLLEHKKAVVRKAVAALLKNMAS